MAWWDDVAKTVSNIDWNPTHGSINTGVGTPWGATGEKAAIDLNPFHSTAGRIIDPFGVGSNLTDSFQGITGLQKLSNQLTGPKTQARGYNVMPGAPVIGGGTGSPFSSLALEERLRSENRAKQPKNVEFGFNLENPPNKRTI